MTAIRYHRFDPTPARALLLLWTLEVLVIMALASRFLAPIDLITGRARARDGVPPGAWFLMHPPLERTDDGVAIDVDAPATDWLQWSSDPAFCCWRRWTLRLAYPGYATAGACEAALAELRERPNAPLALRLVSTSPVTALAAARCVHVTDLWVPRRHGTVR